MSYYLGVTKRGVPFTLNEGVEHSETITEKYNYQDYFYIHKDINTPLNLELNVLNGEVDVFINTRQLNQENIDKIYNKIGSNNFEEKDDIINSLYYKNFIFN